MNIAYVRVATENKEEKTIQVESLKEYNIDKWYIEKSIEKSLNRPELQKMINEASNGDAIYVFELNRLSMDSKVTFSLVDYFIKNGIYLVSVRDNLNTSYETDVKYKLAMMKSFVEHDRKALKESLKLMK